MAFRQNQAGIEKYSGYVYNDPETGQDRPIFLTKEIGRPEKRHSRVVWHNQEKKVEVATLVAATGDVKGSAELGKVTVGQIRRWMKEPWWEAVIARVRKEHNELLDAKLTHIIARAADKIQERIETGDEVLYKGEPVKKQLSARDLATITNVLFDKRQLLRGEATSRTETRTQEDKLQDLKKKFESWAKVKVIDNDTGDIETIIVDNTDASEIREDQSFPPEVREEQEEGGTGSSSNLQQTAQAGTETSYEENEVTNERNSISYEREQINGEEASGIQSGSEEN